MGLTRLRPSLIPKVLTRRILARRAKLIFHRRSPPTPLLLLERRPPSGMADWADCSERSTSICFPWARKPRLRCPRPHPAAKPRQSPVPKSRACDWLVSFFEICGACEEAGGLRPRRAARRHPREVAADAVSGPPGALLFQRFLPRSVLRLPRGAPAFAPEQPQIGRASCRERGALS